MKLLCPTNTRCLRSVVPSHSSCSEAYHLDPNPWFCLREAGGAKQVPLLLYPQ
ncbi:unnamed protein product [Musa acuminata subsp. malaccensis]|uniref:(wild Malaysian banana) hypothetical protein n=1 Tax=Musa acuminata subsp. malaccensis TaxID=214687 RepID=A0A8D7FB21_MUSAM|nr:unnamed protein product [Musa acuminata subsp. malaccensis]